jgi:hypothetical protein
MEAEEELLKETLRAFKAGLDGETYENPFTEAEEEMHRREAAGEAPLAERDTETDRR